MTALLASSLLDRLGTAGVHTLLGMGTVFCVLVLMIGVISLFKFIPDPEAKKKAAAAAAAASKKAAEPEPVVEQVVEEETDDLALVAVITAAVAAQMGTTSTDGFIVRSIKRAPQSNWKKR